MNLGGKARLAPKTNMIARRSSGPDERSRLFSFLSIGVRTESPGTGSFLRVGYKMTERKKEEIWGLHG